MLPKRVIPCLDIDGGRVVKGTEFVDLRDMGDPVELAQHYETEGADELIFLDITATSERRSPMIDIARDTATKVFIPFTVGGGVRSESDVQTLLDAGADKVAINSAALADPTLLDSVSARFGRQCTVLSIDAKRGDDSNNWEVYAAGGRIPTDRSAVAWAQEGVKRGAGEILLTSIDRDGTNNGYDLDLIKALTKAVNVPVIASGGAGRSEHYGQAISNAGAEAVLAASQFHSGQISIADVKDFLAAAGVAVRPVQSPMVRQATSVYATPRPHIALVDYGTGNRYSVQKAFEYIGANVALTDGSEELAAADGVVLPGVGAFQPAMQRLQETGLSKVICRLAALGKPILGICLGEQLLFDGSREAGWCQGLGLIPGVVQELELPILPNIGWREVNVEQPDRLTANLPEQAYLYHLHQYAATAAQETDVLASTRLPYQENPAYQATSIVKHRNVYGVQFHPEKSGTPGLDLLKNFVNICLTMKTSLQ
jgi:cyclase